MKKHLFINAIKQHLRLYFDIVLIPRQWKIESKIPENSTGKRSVPALQKIFKEST